MIPDDLLTNFHTCIENGCSFSVLFWAVSGGIWKTEQFIDGLLCGKLNARGAHSVGKTLWWKLPIRESLAQYPLNPFLMNTGRVDTGSGVRTRIRRVTTMKGSYPVACGRSSSLARTRRVCLVLIVVTHNKHHFKIKSLRTAESSRFWTPCAFHSPSRRIRAVNRFQGILRN